MLSKFCDERHDDWDQHLPCLLCAYRATVNKSTGCSQNLLMLGRETTLSVDLMYLPTHYQSYNCHNEYVEWLRRALQDSHEKVRHELSSAAQRQKRYYDFRTKNRQFKVGEFVLRFYQPNLRNKLNLPYVGLHHVLAKLGDVTYRIQKSPTSKPINVHVDHLNEYHTTTMPAEWKEVGVGMGQADESLGLNHGMAVG